MHPKNVAPNPEASRNLCPQFLWWESLHAAHTPPVDSNVKPQNVTDASEAYDAPRSIRSRLVGALADGGPFVWLNVDI